MLRTCSLSVCLWLACLVARAEPICLADHLDIGKACSTSALYVYLDRRTVVAGSDSILAVAEAITDAGYSVSDGTYVEFVVRRGRQLFTYSTITQSGLAYAYLPAGNVAGSIEVWAASGSIKAQSQRIDVTHAAPSNFTISVEGCEHGVSCFIATSPLSDIFGNSLNNAQSGLMETWADGRLVAQQTVQVVQGRIRAPWSYPGGDVRISMRIADRTAELWVYRP